MFDYILVDEFQDTNYKQFEILKALINPKTQNIFAVGDPDQTIYTWRGAYPEIVKDFLDEYPKTKTIILDLNYRSTKNILKISNNLIDHNVDRIKKDLITNNEEGKLPTLFACDNQDEESKRVVKKIKELIENKEFDYQDIAILYRANFMSRSIEQQLISSNIPYHIYGGFKFYQRAEIKDLIGYLKLLVFVEDEIALKRIINIPRRNIGEITIDKIQHYADTHNLTFYQALNKSKACDIQLD